MRWRESSKRYAEKMAENLRFDWCEVKGLNFWFWMLNMAIHGWLKLKISAIHPSGWHWRLVLARGWLCTVHAREGSADSKTVGHNKIHGSVWYVRIVLKYLPWKRNIFFFCVLSNCCLLLIWRFCLKHSIFPVVFARFMNEHKFPRWCLCDFCNTWPHCMNVTVSKGIPATGIEIFSANQQGSNFILLDFYKDPLHLQILHHYHRFCRPEEATEYQCLLEQDPYTSMLAKHFLSCSFAFGSFFLFGSASKVSDTQLCATFTRLYSRRFAANLTRSGGHNTFKQEYLLDRSLLCIQQCLQHSPWCAPQLLSVTIDDIMNKCLVMSLVLATSNYYVLRLTLDLQLPITSVNIWCTPLLH